MKHKVGDIICIVKYAKIAKANKSVITVKDLDSEESFNVIGESLIDKLASADNCDEMESVTRTELAGILSTAWCTPFTVTFTKSDGNERILRGRLVEPDTLLGRSMVEDLDQEGGNRIRQVDHRTLTSIVVGGKQYLLKK
jgi:hypothetical protein